MDAEYLILLTDVDGLYTANPKTDPEAKPIHVVENISKLDADVEGKGSAFGTGGMKTKIAAAKLATGYGTSTIICNGQNPEVIVEILEGATKGTRFIPNAKGLSGRKRWVIGLPPQGTITVDKGAAEAVRSRKSLFAAGVVSVAGTFGARDGTGRVWTFISPHLLLVVKKEPSQCVVAVCGICVSELCIVMVPL